MKNEENFTYLENLTPHKIVWHLRHNKIVFLVCRSPENGKYMITSYRLRIRNGRERLAICETYHTSNAAVFVRNQASSYEEWTELLSKGTETTGFLGIECTIINYFKCVFNGEDYVFPENSEFYAYSSDKVSEFGKGIERAFAEYWFSRIKNDGL